MSAIHFTIQDQLIPNSAWKDYSSNTNYAFDAFNETAEKQKRSGRGGSTASTQQTLQMSHSPAAKSQYYNNSETNPMPSTNNRSSRNHDNGTNGRGGDLSGGNSHHYHSSNAYPQHTNEQQQHMSRSSYADRTYSLPRTVVQQQQHMQPSKHQGYYTQDRRNRSSSSGNHHGGGSVAAAGIDQPDFYFMPSQRKYSGEVVRVYVDYNKDPKN